MRPMVMKVKAGWSITKLAPGPFTIKSGTLAILTNSSAADYWWGWPEEGRLSGYLENHPRIFLGSTGAAKW
ncbi:MAG: hypothetical protein R2849_13570 [Thermomicrobiales bacterium]